MERVYGHVSRDLARASFFCPDVLKYGNFSPLAFWTAPLFLLLDNLAKFVVGYFVVKGKEKIIFHGREALVRVHHTTVHVQSQELHVEYYGRGGHDDDIQEGSQKCAGYTTAIGT